ncbi:hypothetical protein AA0Z99_03735 [Agrococcus sp. 1P02AA]|uniref:DUF6993 domain-containing protein n=1 Tax=Agrococcus sp. 1P02AA TaxID=3132259 RepID=UPI0039A75A7C
MRRIAALAVLASLVLVGCSTAPQPEPSGDADDRATGAQTTTAPGEPGDAAQPDPELDAFRASLVGHTPLDPDSLVAAVEGAGFERSAIERTREVDSLGAPVTFLEIAVHVGGECLVGQVGDGEPMAVRAAALGGDRCLVGDVIALD